MADLVAAALTGEGWDLPGEAAPAPDPEVARRGLDLCTCGADRSEHAADGVCARTSCPRWFPTPSVAQQLAATPVAA